uniref:Ixodegrin B n=1 Tax=Rhipicephalus appendiculatus TaxID=34631 RepID=A0A131YN94_RHIAP
MCNLLFIYILLFCALVSYMPGHIRANYEDSLPITLGSSLEKNVVVSERKTWWGRGNKDVGERCRMNGECEGDLCCVKQRGPPRCQLKAEMGEPCGISFIGRGYYIGHCGCAIWGARCVRGRCR